MALDISNTIVATVVLVIGLIVFAISYSIYRRTRGGSYGFKCWAVGAGSYLIGSACYLVGIIVTQNPDGIIINALDNVLFGDIGGLFILLGVLFLGADLKTFGYSRKSLGRLQLILIILSLAMFIVITSMGFSGILTEGETLVAGKSSAALFQAVLLSVAAMKLHPLYQTLRQGTRAWSLIYLGLVSIIAANITELFLFTGLEILNVVDVLSSFAYAVFLISGFFLLDRSMKG